ncbi:hypothetical protein Acr_03g0007710 [Actinidia rufa]|uniref:Uncharacterized protein n=1 Tax=Actinidia rufa TaxID=165716 RepID=A0A7J0EEC6_9ERIC|nr:hypothetical protein Acr_03g0007710 [Actinidia rufa]
MPCPRQVQQIHLSQVRPPPLTCYRFQYKNPKIEHLRFLTHHRLKPPGLERIENEPEVTLHGSEAHVEEDASGFHVLLSKFFRVEITHLFGDVADHLESPTPSSQRNQIGVANFANRIDLLGHLPPIDDVRAQKLIIVTNVFEHAEPGVGPPHSELVMDYDEGEATAVVRICGCGIKGGVELGGERGLERGWGVGESIEEANWGGVKGSACQVFEIRTVVLQGEFGCNPFGEERCLVTLITGPVGFLVFPDSTRSGCSARIRSKNMLDVNEPTNWKNLCQPMREDLDTGEMEEEGDENSFLFGLAYSITISIFSQMINGHDGTEEHTSTSY